MADQPPNDLVPVNAGAGGPPSDLVPVSKSPAAPPAAPQSKFGSLGQFLSGTPSSPGKDPTVQASNDPEKTYYDVLPLAQSKKTGQLELAYPKWARAPQQSADVLQQAAEGKRQLTPGQIGLAGMDVAGLSPTSTVRDMVSGLAREAPTTLKMAKDFDTSISKETIAALKRAAAGDPDRAAAKLTNKAIEKINKRAAADEVTAQSVMDAQAVANAAGNKTTLLDMGKNLQGLGGSLYRTPGRASADLRKFLDARVEAQKGQLTGGIEELAKGSSYDTINRFYAERSTAARPLYKEAESVAPIYSDRLKEFMGDREFRAAMSRGARNEIREAIAEGRPVHNEDYAIVGWNEAGDPVIGPTPTMKTLMLAKEGMDARIAEMVDPATGRITKDGLALKKFKDAYLNELDKLNPKYKAAREAWAGPTESAQAVDAGRKHFSRGETDPQVRAEFDELSDANKDFYRLGAAEAKLDQMRAGPKAGDRSKRIVNSDKDEDRWRMMFDDKDSADRFINSVEAQRQAFETRTKIAGGSQSLERAAEDQSQGMDDFLKVIDVAGKATTNPLMAAIKAYQMKRDLGLRNNPALNQELVRILTDPNLRTGPGPNLLSKVAVPPRQSYLPDVLGTKPGAPQ